MAVQFPAGRRISPLSPSPGPPITRRVAPDTFGFGIPAGAPDQLPEKTTLRPAAFAPPASCRCVAPSGYCVSLESSAREPVAPSTRLRQVIRARVVTWRMCMVPPAWIGYRKLTDLANFDGLFRPAAAPYGPAGSLKRLSRA